MEELYKHGRAKDVAKNVWQDFVNGDTYLFRQVFEKYYDQMYGYGLKLCEQPDIVKDSIQELFQTIWEKRTSLRHIHSPNVYLYVSLRRKILKKVERQQSLVSLDKLDKTSFCKFGIEEIIIKDETKYHQKKRLQEALNSLSDRQKEVIYLHFYNGMSYEEIEEILSINHQSVKNHVYRGMQCLRSFLDKEIMKLVVSIMIAFISFC